MNFSGTVATALASSDHRIVVTGAGGWLGQATLEMLDSALGAAFDRRVVAYASSSRPYALRSGRTVALRQLDELSELPAAASYIFHYAYLGKEKVAQLGAESFRRVNDRINDIVGAYCSRTPEGGIFFASSGAAHFAQGSRQDAAREPYGASKVRDEARFLALSTPGFSVSMLRIFNLAGPFINKLGEYALSSILLDIDRGGPIRIRARNPVLRSFVHVRDVVDLAASLLVSGTTSRAYDTGSDEIVEIGDLARRAANVLQRPGIGIERPAVEPFPVDRYAGDAKQFQTLLLERGIEPVGLDAQILDTARYLRSVSSGPRV